MNPETLNVAIITLISTIISGIVGVILLSIRARMAKESQERKAEADDRKREAEDRKREAEENRQLMINNFEGMKTVTSLYEKERDRAVNERNEMAAAVTELRISLVEIRTRLETEVSYFQSENVKLRSGIEDAKRASSEQALRIATAEKTITALNGEVVRLNLRNEEASKAYEIELTKLAQAAQEKDRLIIQLEKEKQEMATKLAQVLTELAEVRRDVDKLRTEIHDLRMDIARKDQQIATLTQERDDARSQVKVLSEQLSKAQQGAAAAPTAVGD